MLLCLGCVGCSKFQTARECGVFVAAIKTWKEQAPKPAGSASAPARAPSPATVSIESRALADRYDALAKRIDDLHLSSGELEPRAAAYQKLARAAAAALRDVAHAVEQDDAEGARRRRIEFDDIARGEAPLVADINSICR